jgi:hypothetical protein
MEYDLWEATAKGVTEVQLRRWTAQIVGSHSSICMTLARLTDTWA